MFRKSIYLISMFMVVILLSVGVTWAAGSDSKNGRQADAVNATRMDEGQRPVLTVTPREIDLGSIRPVKLFKANSV